MAMFFQQTRRAFFNAKWSGHLSLARCTLLALLVSSSVFAAASLQSQNKKSNKIAPATNTGSAVTQLARSTTRHETRRFGYGSTLTLLGAPSGSVSIEAWPRSEVDITADIELHADSEADLARLALVNNFIIDEDTGHLRIITTGTHDKAFMRRVAKDFPKKLLALPWKVDYRIRVPINTDLEVDMGRGPFTINGVDGAIRFNALESDASLTLTGGLVNATVGRGQVSVKLASRSWRGTGADIRLASGDLTVELPAGFSGDINADVLRSGRIENTYAALAPRARTGNTSSTIDTSRSLQTRAGSGGAMLHFTVGDGTLRIKPAVDAFANQ